MTSPMPFRIFTNGRRVQPMGNDDAASMTRSGIVLLTGATGYVGGRLLHVLERGGVPVRCVVRDPGRLASRVAESTEVVAGDALDAASLVPALRGVDTAYYLIHSMGVPGDFERLDRRAAENFASAAGRAGVRRIIYLGGLGSGAELSSHLRSRQEVGRILRSSGVPTVELRASIVIGSGSLSFEMVRALVEKLPVMVTPKWVDQPAQPIAIEDLVAYLDEARTLPIDSGVVYEIGGADRVSYRDIMLEYARQRGLRRRMLRVPVLTPRLSSLWLGLVTPVYARVGRKLLDGVRNPTVVEDDRARRDFRVRPRGISEAIARALENEDRRCAETRWSDAVSSGRAGPPDEAALASSRIVDTRARSVPVAPELAFAPIRRIGGDVGWYWGDPLWRLRGFIDLLIGGVGMRRGRRDPESLAAGEPLDFWRVEAFEPPTLLRLRAEMKLPGRAWLQFEVSPDGDGSRIRQTAIFDPAGFGGRLYWYALLPIHRPIFDRMLARIAAAADGPSAPVEPSGEPRRSAA